jgi:hypothetical protein
MSTCANCGTKLSCGCQKRTTADGKSACTNCVNKTQPSVKKTTTTTTLTANVGGPNRYKNLHKFLKK